MTKITTLTLIMIQAILLLGGCSDKTERQTVDVFWGLLGDYPEEKQFNPYALTRADKTIDSASILYSIRMDYKTIEQISKQTRIEVRDVEKKISELKECGLVKEQNNAFIVNFPFWDKPLRDKINSLGLELTNQIVQILKSEIPNLKNIFEGSSLSMQGYHWNDISLIIIGGLLLDTGLNDRGLRKWRVFDKLRDIPVRPGGYYYWFKAVENGWGNFWKFGHDTIHNETSDIWFGMFYGSIKGRKVNWGKAWDVFESNTDKIIFPLIKKGNIAISDLRSEWEIPLDSLEAILSKMERAKIVRINDSIVYPNFPIFDQNDIDNILVEVDSICNRIINDVYVPFLPRIEETWQDIKPANWDMMKIEKFFTREVYDRPYNLTLDELIREGILPRSPVEPPFNYWGINGYFKVL